MSGIGITNPMFRSPVSGRVWPGDGSDEGAQEILFVPPTLLPFPEAESGSSVEMNDGESIK